MTILPRLMCILSVAVLAGCATAPKSYVDSETPLTTNQATAVRVVSIDGSISFGSASRQLNVAPGLRRFVLESKPKSMFSIPNPSGQKVLQKMYTIGIEPCTAYVFGARRNDPTDLDWELVIEKNPVHGCDIEEERKKAGIGGGR